MSQTAPESPSTPALEAVPAGEAGQEGQAPRQGTTTPSAPADGYVEKARYDGQVRKVNELMAEKAELERRLQGQAPTQTAPQPQQAPEGELSTDDMVRILFMREAATEQARVVETVLRDFPDAEPFKDALSGSEAEVREQAAYFATKTQAIRGTTTQPAPANTPGSPEAPAQAPASPPPVVTAGAQAVQAPEGDEELRQQLTTILAKGTSDPLVMREYTAFKQRYPHIRVKPATKLHEWERAPGG